MTVILPTLYIITPFLVYQHLRCFDSRFCENVSFNFFRWFVERIEIIESFIKISQALISCLPLFGNMITVILVNRSGKRILTLFSLSTTSVIYIVYSLLNCIMNVYEIANSSKIVNSVYMIQGVSFSIWIFMLSIGIEPITDMLITEIFPAKWVYVTEK